ncbi:hypothetical protein BH20ACI1_BH20ACI1_20600 [soil metagenome]
MSLRDIEKSYLSQLVFGEDTKEMKTFRNVRKFVDYTQILLIVTVITAFLTLYFSGYPVKLRSVPLIIGIFVLFDFIRRIVRYFEKRKLKENNKRTISDDKKQNEVEARETTKLIEEKEFVPASSVTESSTQLLYADRKSGESE